MTDKDLNVIKNMYVYEIAPESIVKKQRLIFIRDFISEQNFPPT